VRCWFALHDALAPVPFPIPNTLTVGGVGGGVTFVAVAVPPLAVPPNSGPLGNGLPQQIGIDVPGHVGGIGSLDKQPSRHWSGVPQKPPSPIG
jgi:hypothetical protein